MQVKRTEWHLRGQRLAKILSVIGLGLFFLSMGLDTHYSDTKPAARRHAHDLDVTLS